MNIPFVSFHLAVLVYRAMNVAAAPTATTPLRRLALHSTSTCATQASAYGQCILATYKDVKKDACKAEFLQFGQCLREAVCELLFNFRNLLTRSTDEAEMVTYGDRKIPSAPSDKHRC